MKPSTCPCITVALVICIACPSAAAEPFIAARDNVRTSATLLAAAGPRSTRFAAPSAAHGGGFLPSSVAPAAPSIAGASAAPGDAPARAGVRFTENRGQVADSDGRIRPDILYTADVPGARIYFGRSGVYTVFSRAERGGGRVSEATGAAMQTSAGEASPIPRRSVCRVDMRFEGANPTPRVRSGVALRGYANYYAAHCPGGVTFVRSYDGIVYEDLYDNIDLAYRASGARVKYEFIVRPGGDPSRIRLRYDGADALRLNAGGGVVVETPLGSVTDDAPVCYQDGAAVPSTFDLRGQVLGFRVGIYDPSRTLLIDPWATYFGGGEEECFHDVECDAAGYIYTAGSVHEQDFPVINGFQSLPGGLNDLIAAKFSPSGIPEWSTYYGGPSTEGLYGRVGLGVSAAGACAVFACAYPPDFPTTPNALQPVAPSSSGDECVLAVLNANGTRAWATYFSGTGSDGAWDAAMDSQGNLVLTGSTASADFPIYRAFQSTLAGSAPSNDGFIAKFTSGGALCWSTYLGGAAHDVSTAIAVGPDDAIAVVGHTESADFPVTSGAFQSSAGGGADAFVARFDSSGNRLWASYLGGNQYDKAFGVAVDPSGNIAVGGGTRSANFPVYGAMQSVHRNPSSTDAFIAYFSPAGTRQWSTFYGGDDTDNITSIAMLSGGDLCVYGQASATNFPIANAAFSTPAIDFGFVARVTSACALVWSTYFPRGSGPNYPGSSIARTLNDELVVATWQGASAPVLNAYQAVNKGYSDAYLATLEASGFFPVALVALHASAHDGCAVLRWETASETRNAGFGVERALQRDGPWEARGFVAGSGDASRARSYEFSDPLPSGPPPGGDVWYRLRQTDFDGRETLSPVVSVSTAVPRPQIRLSVRPNPVETDAFFELRIPSAQQCGIALYDRLGRRLRLLRDGFVEAGGHTFVLRRDDLPDGVYFLRAEAASGTAVARVVLRGR